MMRGEFTALSTMDSSLPGLVPKPHGWGKFHQGDYSFLIEDFVDMDTGGAPDPEKFPARVAELHHKVTSPNGMFGFHVTTCDGRVPHYTTWKKSWATFFSKFLRRIMDISTEVNGPWPELEAAEKQFFDKVIPRLLGVLQSEGREIKPSLLHSDCMNPSFPSVLFFP